MVTHVPPPSPSLSSASLSTITGSIPPYNRRASSRAPSQAPSSAAQRYAPPSFRLPPPAPPPSHPPIHFPPSPPLSHSHASSPPSSYVAPRLDSDARTSYTSSRHAPSVAGSRLTTATTARDSSRQHRHRSGVPSQAESRPHHKRRHSSRAQTSVPSSAVEETYSDDHNEFPWFGQSGDVEITLKTRDGRVERRYKLHNLILRQNSKWWDQQLDAVSGHGAGAGGDRGRAEEQVQAARRSSRSRSSFSTRSSRRRHERQPAAAPEPAQRGSTSAPWSFELDWTSESAHDGIPMLAPITTTLSSHSTTTTTTTTTTTSTSTTSTSSPPVRNNKPPASNSSFFRHLTSRHTRPSSSSSTSTSTSSSATRSQPANQPPSQSDKDILKAYTSLLLTIYNHAPALDPRSLPDAYVQSKILLRLAHPYHALPIVRPRIEHHLLHFHRALYLQIARYPPSYLKLGHRLRSRKIFSEALVHVVGAWPLHARYLVDIDERVRDLVQDKADDLSEMRDRVDGKLFRLSLTTPRGERVGPRVFIDWMAISLFRQWLSDATTTAALSPKPILKGAVVASVEPVVPGRAYRLMARGGDAYLCRAELKEFLKRDAPRECYSREGLKRLERRVEDVKVLARDAVRGLNRSFLEGDEPETETGTGTGYLTCTRVEERDLEWVWGGEGEG